MKSVWYLEGFESRSQRLVRAPIKSLPFTVGRRSSSELSLQSKMVSQTHAEIFERDGALWLNDPGSTNGTFVNGKRLDGEDHPLFDGDILHFADLEYRLVRNVTEETSWPALTQTMKLSSLPGGGVARYREVREILQSNALRALFQPLVDLGNGGILGYEALGRGTLENAPTSPGELFMTAEAIGLATELSVKLRNQAILDASRLPNPQKVFLNTHPSELANRQSLLASLEPLHLEKPDFEVVLEIHEGALTDITSLRNLREELDDMGIGVAFDDFGTGQARLLELAEASPHYLKFDAAMIRDIHLNSKKKQHDLVEKLVKIVLDLGIIPIAEGVEVVEEAQTCHRLGFQYGQGYLFARPSPPETFVTEEHETEVG